QINSIIGVVGRTNSEVGATCGPGRPVSIWVWQRKGLANVNDRFSGGIICIVDVGLFAISQSTEEVPHRKPVLPLIDGVLNQVHVVLVLFVEAVERNKHVCPTGAIDIGGIHFLVLAPAATATLIRLRPHEVPAYEIAQTE